MCSLYSFLLVYLNKFFPFLAYYLPVYHHPVRTGLQLPRGIALQPWTPVTLVWPKCPTGPGNVWWGDWHARPLLVLISQLLRESLGGWCPATETKVDCHWKDPSPLRRTLSSALAGCHSWSVPAPCGPGCLGGMSRRTGGAGWCCWSGLKLVLGDTLQPTMTVLTNNQSCQIGRRLAKQRPRAPVHTSAGKN